MRQKGVHLKDNGCWYHDMPNKHNQLVYVRAKRGGMRDEPNKRPSYVRGCILKNLKSISQSIRQSLNQSSIFRKLIGGLLPKH